MPLSDLYTVVLTPAVCVYILITKHITNPTRSLSDNPPPNLSTPFINCPSYLKSILWTLSPFPFFISLKYRSSFAGCLYYSYSALRNSIMADQGSLWESRASSPEAPKPPLDLSHHFSRVTTARDANSLKQLYKYMGIPGIGNVAGGTFLPS